MKLNCLVHPAVKEYIASEIEKERKEGKVPFVAVEAALLIEDHYDTICDELWYVYADEDARRRRLAASRGYQRKIGFHHEKSASGRDFSSLHQFVIDNSNEIVQNTYEQIDRGLKEHGIL